MSEKKNIDRLFQEKFKDFEVAPPENLWQNIEAELQKKKKKRVIPLWFMLSGAAAILIIGLLVLFPSKGIEGNQNTPVVIGNPENNSGNTPEGAVKATTIENSIKTEEAVTQAQETQTTPGDKASQTVNKTDKSNGVTAPVKNGKAASGDRINAINKNNAVAYGPKQQNSQKRNKVNGDRPEKINTERNPKSGFVTEEGVAYNNNTDAVNKSATSGNDNNNTNKGVQPDNNVQNEKLIPVNNKETAIAVTQNNEVKQGAENQVSDEEKNRILQENLDRNLNKEAVADTPVDTVKVAPVNELEELLKKKEEQKEEEKALADAGNKEKWNVKPQIAPVFYNSFSEGSPIDSQFNGNSKSYDNDLSYGVGIDYALNDRFSIRSGVNNVNLSYSTNGVEFHASLSEQTNNIAAKGVRANIVVQNADANPDPTPMPTDGFATLAASSMASQTFNGSMIQEMGYIEVPLEMSYKLLNKKFGIEVIGGMSTLFLNNNNVSVMSDQGYKSDIGEAENLNSVSFSANAGIGFKYRFLKMFEASFEPTLKYQVNTFSENAGNFKPYFIGLYSGISFRF